MTQRIAVTGSGSASGPPDVAIVSAGVEVLARTVAEARARAATEAKAVLEAMKANGVEGADITTAAFTVNPEYDHQEGRRLRGYRVTNTVEAKLRNVEGVGVLIDAVAAAGSNSTVVNGISFTHEDATPLEVVARNAAWEDAHRKASQLAKLAGVQLGKVIAVSEQSHAAPRPQHRAMAMESAAPTPVEAGQLGVGVTLVVEYEIAPAK